MRQRLPDYTPEEDKVVLDFTLDDKQIAEKLGRTVESVKSRRYLIFHRDDLKRVETKIVDWPTTTISELIRQFEDDIRITKESIISLKKQYIEKRVEFTTLKEFGDCDEESQQRYKKELSSLSNSISRNKRHIASIEKKIDKYRKMNQEPVIG